MPHHPARFRGVCAVAGLTLAVAVGACGITGCTGDSAPDRPTRTTAPRPPTAEELAQAAAVARTRALLDAGLRTRTRRPVDRALVKAVVAGHEAHLAALGATGGTTITGDATASPSATSSASVTPPGGTESPGRTESPGGTQSPAGSTPASVNLAALARQEYDAARETLGAVEAVEPGLATLLARQAASLAVNADLLGRAAKSPARGVLTPDVTPLPSTTGTPEASGTTTGAAPTGGTPGPDGSTGSEPPGGTATSGPADGLSTAALDGLSQELAGEHVAVYAFALLAGRSKGPAHERALEAYATHVTLRDELERTLLDAGADPPVAYAAYDVGPVPATAAGIADLAASVETSLASLAAQSVGATEGATRAEAASRLVEAARRSATWTRRPVALPGEGVPPPPTGTITDPGTSTSTKPGAAEPTTSPAG